MHRYSPALVTLSVVLAVVISFVALWLTFHFRGDTAPWGWMKITSALVMGAAIPVMHYTGMAAASFTHSSSLDQHLSHAVSISSLGITSIVGATVIVLGLVLLTSLVDRRMSLQIWQEAWLTTSTIFSDACPLDALTAFRSDPDGYDLVITDPTMPNLTGTALAAELLKLRADVPIVLTTGFGRLATLIDGVHRALEPQEFVQPPTLAG
jgi:CheY-like chemotaxis protein